MHKRCEDPKNKSYLHYGARGITVCARWREFENFLADIGPRPSARHSLDRVDNDGNYEPLNCRWSLPIAQTRNRGCTRIVEFRGEARPLGEWTERLGLRYSSVNTRLNIYGWSVDRALSTPIAPRRARA